MGPQMPLSFDDWATSAGLPRKIVAISCVELPAPTNVPRARNTDPATCKQAAHSVRSVASDHHLRIIGALYMPATATEIAAATGLTMVQCARRLPELQALKLVRPTGKTRATASGRQSREWERVK